jgi:spore maturation protein CgeB
MNYKFLKISSYYSDYLEYFYKKHQNIPENYNSHLRLLLDDFFSYGDAFSRYLKKLGNEAYEIIYNDEILQKKWAHLNGIKVKKGWQKNILLEQIRKIKPDVIFWETFIDDNFLKYIKDEFPGIRINFTQTGVKIKNYKYYQEFDFIISCLKSQVNDFNSKNKDAYFIKHGFHPLILNKIKKDKKNIDFSFFGSIISGESYHNKRAEYLEYFIKTTPLEIHSNFKNPTFIEHLRKFVKKIIKPTFNALEKIGVSDYILPEKIKFNRIKNWEDDEERIQFTKDIEKKINRPVYGLDMFQKIADSKISFNIHIGEAGNQAANMRMYEVTGMGTCLLTDWKEDIKEYFEPDYEIVTYKSKKEALEKVKFLLDNTKEREKIEINGQKKTLKNHTTEDRIKEINQIVLKYL